MGALVPPYDGSHGLHGTMAAIEYAVLGPKVERIIVWPQPLRGHPHRLRRRTGRSRGPARWLKLLEEAMLPVVPSPEAMQRTEQRGVVLQLERLLGYPMVRRAVEAGHLSLHGWHYVIEDGEVHVFRCRARRPCPPRKPSRPSGTGPLPPLTSRARRTDSDRLNPPRERPQPGSGGGHTTMTSHLHTPCGPTAHPNPAIGHRRRLAPRRLLWAPHSWGFSPATVLLLVSERLVGGADRQAGLAGRGVAGTAYALSPSPALVR